jgi:MFS transporter, NNP family, nitrate/nitrite transporter
MLAKTATSPEGQRRALWMSTIAFTVCFAVWTIFAIIGVQIKQELGLNETQFGLLVGTPILTGSLVRIFLGIWTDQYGGRRIYTVVMLAAAVATFLLVYAHTYVQILIAALGVGIAGGSFAVGIAYVSRWYPAEKQGTAADGLDLATYVPQAVQRYASEASDEEWVTLMGLLNRSQDLGTACLQRAFEHALRG